MIDGYGHGSQGQNQSKNREIPRYDFIEFDASPNTQSDNHQHLDTNTRIFNKAICFVRFLWVVCCLFAFCHVLRCLPSGSWP